VFTAIRHFLAVVFLPFFPCTISALEVIAIGAILRGLDDPQTSDREIRYLMPCAGCPRPPFRPSHSPPVSVANKTAIFSVYIGELPPVHRNPEPTGLHARAAALRSSARLRGRTSPFGVPDRRLSRSLALRSNQLSSNSATGRATGLGARRSARVYPGGLGQPRSSYRGARQPAARHASFLETNLKAAPPSPSSLRLLAAAASEAVPHGDRPTLFDITVRERRRSVGVEPGSHYAFHVTELLC
jgi:hypothetical protein